jgi:hypothetical protein
MAGQVTDVLKRLGVSEERMITTMIERHGWLTMARQESRRLVIGAGLSDDDIDGSSSCVLNEPAQCRPSWLSRRLIRGVVAVYNRYSYGKEARAVL